MGLNELGAAILLRNTWDEYQANANPAWKLSERCVWPCQHCISDVELRARVAWEFHGVVATAADCPWNPELPR